MSDPTFDLVATHHVLTMHLGVAGTLFGGMLLAWVDEAAALYANKAADNRFVTFELEKVRFLLPCMVGDIVEVGARPLKASRSGLQLELRVARLGKDDVKETVLSTRAVMVAVDGEGKKVPVAFKAGWAVRFEKA
ncbi:MAG TPA: hotdog domain-containing protein [Holophagaceae bacterium]|jgi:acyl-CoA hydrolase|nr:hotdog domain-containing protein [Holophagaceae bacterium]